MTTVTNPSDDFPAPPRLGLDCPDGWHPLPDAGQALAIIKDVPDGEFRPNVIVAVRRMRRGTAMAAARRELQQRAASLREYASIGEEERVVGGWPGYRTEGSFIDEPGGTLVQAIRLAVVDRGATEDLVQVSATCHATQAEAVWQQIRDIQESLTIGVDG
ncbi:MAG: LpqN/LpqT family lipoprotein [Actinomycetia bacterium]|nr:LpqN/LpqT family lipoprotein [Actinomycetes bacterium]